jgi:hypothetical protein
MGRIRKLKTMGVVNDMTPHRLSAAGWRCEDFNNWYTALWMDPRTGIWWSTSQAAAILKDRETPKYDFR